MYYHAVIQQIVDGMILLMAGLLLLFTLALIVLHFIINANQARMQRIRQQVLCMINANAKIEYLRGEIYQVANSPEECASLRGIRGIRSQRGVQVLEMVSRELDPRQIRALRTAVEESWYAAYLRKTLSGGVMDLALLATKLVGQLELSGYSQAIEQNFARWPKDAMVQEIGLLTLFLLGERERVVRLLSDPQFRILLSFRTLHELFLHYHGDHVEFYRTLFSKAQDQYVRRACIRGIRESGCGELCGMLQPELSSPHMNVLLETIRTLGGLGFQPAVEQIRDLTRHEAWEVRCAAVDALAALDREGCYEALLRCLCDRAWWVRFHAAEALVTLPCRETLLSDVAGCGDAYAQEMLWYIIERDLILTGGAA